MGAVSRKVGRKWPRCQGEGNFRFYMELGAPEGGLEKQLVVAMP